jgi:MFS family permease
MCAALALVVSAVASLNIALPDLATDLGATQTDLQWIVDSYAVVFAGLLLPAGAIGDRFGRRRILLAGLTVFGLAYLVGAFATAPGTLIAARAGAGAGAALIMPATLSILTTVYPPEERDRAVSVWAGVAGAGAVLGLLISGVLIEVADWKWVFAANAGWALLALVAAVRSVPAIQRVGTAALDPVGAILSASGLAALVLAVVEGPHRGWTDGLVVAGLGGGALLLTTFVLWERTRAEPLLDPRLFALRGSRPEPPP